MNILFFAALREQLGCATYTTELTLPTDTDTVRMHLRQAFPQHAELLNEGKALIAVNQTLVHSNTRINDGDEVAFFPPVTGG